MTGYVCPDCGRAFARHPNYLWHRSSVHERGEPPMYGSERRKRDKGPA